MSNKKETLETSALKLCEEVSEFTFKKTKTYINLELIFFFIFFCKAISSMNFLDHHGTHPTLGIVDNIVFSPLGSESLLNAKQVAYTFSGTKYIQ